MRVAKFSIWTLVVNDCRLELARRPSKNKERKQLMLRLGVELGIASLQRRRLTYLATRGCWLDYCGAQVCMYHWVSLPNSSFRCR